MKDWNLRPTIPEESAEQHPDWLDEIEAPGPRVVKAAQVKDERGTWEVKEEKIPTGASFSDLKPGPRVVEAAQSEDRKMHVAARELKFQSPGSEQEASQNTKAKAETTTPANVPWQTQGGARPKEKIKTAPWAAEKVLGEAAVTTSEQLKLQPRAWRTESDKAASHVPKITESPKKSPRSATSTEFQSRKTQGSPVKGTKGIAVVEQIETTVATVVGATRTDKKSTTAGMTFEVDPDMDYFSEDKSAAVGTRVPKDDKKSSDSEAQSSGKTPKAAVSSLSVTLSQEAKGNIGQEGGKPVEKAEKEPGESYQSPDKEQSANEKDKAGANMENISGAESLDWSEVTSSLSTNQRKGDKGQSGPAKEDAVEKGMGASVQHGDAESNQTREKVEEDAEKSQASSAQKDNGAGAKRKEDADSQDKADQKEAPKEKDETREDAKKNVMKETGADVDTGDNVAPAQTGSQGGAKKGKNKKKKGKKKSGNNPTPTPPRPEVAQTPTTPESTDAGSDVKPKRALALEKHQERCGWTFFSHLEMLSLGFLCLQLGPWCLHHCLFVHCPQTLFILILFSSTSFQSGGPEMSFILKRSCVEPFLIQCAAIADEDSEKQLIVWNQAFGCRIGVFG